MVPLEKVMKEVENFRLKEEVFERVVQGEDAMRGSEEV